ncbi:hypothetical protein AJ79_07984 [Helicocarpus griseus UAMH5409]|uniref:Wax synthase domain-containing protein n=1 Tax=Helicocarpus griseus UAMH5409 TaxID=1447875 RepID=A0A2B7WX93_9EURO|nr:hypothetical protein AJ79_07984 [Helicocarpus griseus UAMH5409]
MDEAGIPASYLDASQQLQVQYDEAAASGLIRPVLFPQCFLPIIILILSLVLKLPRKGLFKIVNYLSFGSICYFSFSNILYCRMLGAANGFVFGAASFWYIVLSASLLLINDPQRDFKRIEKRTIYLNSERREEVYHAGQITATTSSASISGSGIKGTLSEFPRRTTEKPGETPTGHAFFPNEAQEICILSWQAYPDSFFHRLAWVSDLIFSMRGPGWNWRISTIPKLPQSVSAQLDRHEINEPEIIKLRDTKSAAKSVFVQLALNYMGLDLMKVLMMHDPYFWGVIPSPPPPPFDSLGIVGEFSNQIYRRILPIGAIFCAATCVISSISLFYLGVALWIPGVRVWVTIPLEAPWLHPDAFEPRLPYILDYGVLGFWSKWWHQLFRFTFLQPSSWVYARLPRRLHKPLIRRTLQLYIVFGLSGLLHAAGSYTQLAPTNPFPNMFLFFFFQAPAIMFQGLVAKLVVAFLPFQPPRWLRRLANLVFFVAWGYFIGPLGADDWAKGGTWLIEPVPLSLLRGLGFGAEGQGWWYWKGPWFRWWHGEKWWDVGIQIL